MQDIAVSNALSIEGQDQGAEVGNPVLTEDTGVIPAIQITIFDDTNQIVRQDQRAIQDFFPSN